MVSNSFSHRLLDEMQNIRTVDCHAHTFSPEIYRKNGPYDLFTNFAYFKHVLLSCSGKTVKDIRKARERYPSNVSVTRIISDVVFGTDRWKVLKGILARARNMSFWRHNIVMYKYLFDFQDEELNDGNWQELNEKIRERTSDPGWYDHVTDLCNLETQVKMIRWFNEWETKYFSCSILMQDALSMLESHARKWLQTHLNGPVDDLTILKEGLKEVAEEYKRKGAVGIDLAHSYFRSLDSENVSDKKASAIYKKALNGEKVSPQQVKAFQDHIIFFLADLAGELNLAFQIHTGPSGYIPDGNPLLLIPLIKSHPSTKFDLKHMGYPYSRETGMLGKHYPNVYLNMSWTYLITMEGSRQTLNEWIDLVPGDRILGFGSDVKHPELIYGHLVMARSCIADVLSEKVKRDFISKEVALDLARKMMRENPIELYSL